MEVSEELMAVAERSERSYGPPVLAMRLDSPWAPDRLAHAARAVVGSIDAGSVHWSVEREPAGVVVRQWGFVPDIGETLRALARGLGDRGVPGRLAAHDVAPPTPAVSLRERDAELLECHLRTRGERRIVEDRWGSGVRLFPDEAALLAGIEVALAWVGSPPPDAQLWSQVGPHRDIGEVRAHLAAALVGTAGQRGRAFPTAWWWESGDNFRLGYVSTQSGDVSLAEGGAALAAGDWRPAHDALLDALRAASGWASYGLIKRGRRPGQVGSSLAYDWVPPFHYGMYNVRHHLYEDVLAPDAFGAQLLGPGYAGRVPRGEDWERVDVGDDAVLVLHRDPAAWFGCPLPPITIDDALLRNPDYPTPEVIVRARDDFAAVLITSDVVRARPIDQMGGRRSND